MSCESVRKLMWPNPLSTNPTKWSNTLKQFVGKLGVFDHFVGLARKGKCFEMLPKITGKISAMLKTYASKTPVHRWNLNEGGIYLKYFSVDFLKLLENSILPLAHLYSPVRNRQPAQNF